jgi:hypothetical protein
MTRVLLLALLAVGCSHVQKRTTETTTTQERAVSTATNAVATVSSSVAEQSKSVKRTARRVTKRPDGWTVTEEVIDDLISVASTGTVRSDAASASRTSEVAKATTATKSVAVARVPLWHRWWWPFAVLAAFGVLVWWGARAVVAKRWWWPFG